jgi:hypothetical protein
MAVPPSDLTAISAAPIQLISLSWTNADVYSSIDVYRNASKIATIGDVEFYDDSTVSYDVAYTYYVKVWKSGVGTDSNTDICAMWTFTATDTTTTSDTHTKVLGYIVTKTDTCTVTDNTGTDTGIAYSDEHTDTCTVTDAIDTALIVYTEDYAYYLGSDNGKIYSYGPSYLGDNTGNIPCLYECKKLDFTDQYPQFDEYLKLVSRVRLIYVDRGAVTFNLYISTDGGVTWESKTRTVGNGDLSTKETTFFFNKIGRFFNFKIENSSNSINFQWIALEIEFEPREAWFEIN